MSLRLLWLLSLLKYINVLAKIFNSSHNLTNPQFPNFEFSLLCPQIQKNECICRCDCRPCWHTLFKTKDINFGVHHIIWRIHNLTNSQFANSQFWIFTPYLKKRLYYSVLLANTFITLLTTKFYEFTISEFPKNHWLWNSWNHIKNLKFECHLFRNRECKLKLSKYLDYNTKSFKITEVLVNVLLCSLMLCFIGNHL